MRIALIAGGAEPGRDGIGDHARLLARELIRRGHSAWILAIADAHIEEPGSTTFTLDGIEITALRLPERLSNARRYELAGLALDNAQAEAVLYDFSPTQYEGRGLIWSVARQMASLAYGRKRAILMHEYSLGRQRGAGLKRRLWGRGQTWGFRRFARALNGLRFATTNLVYARMLERDGFAAQIVPLYGNIPVLPPPPTNWCHVRLREAGIAPQGARGFYCAGFFGSLYEGAELGPALPTLQAAAAKAGGRLCILSVGHQGASEAIWNAWREKFAADATFLAVGRQEAADISAYIQSLDLGLATASVARAGKSGSLAAFLDHGLPSLVLSDYEHYEFLSDSTKALPAGALPFNEETSALLRTTPILPRAPRGDAAVKQTADWLERALET